MSSVQIRPPRFISPKILFCAKYELCAWAFSSVRAIRACARLASSRVTHSCPQVKALAVTSLATQSAPSVAPKVVKSGRPDSFRPVVKPSRKVRTLRLGFFNLSATHALRQANFPPSQAAGRYAAPRSKMMNHVGAGIKKAIVIPPIMWTTPITTAKIIL